jgi:hypothetical protein
MMNTPNGEVVGVAVQSVRATEEEAAAAASSSTASERRCRQQNNSKVHILTEHSTPMLSPEQLRMRLRSRALRLRRAYQPHAALFLARTLVSRYQPPGLCDCLS